MDQVLVAVQHMLTEFDRLVTENPAWDILGAKGKLFLVNGMLEKRGVVLAVFSSTALFPSSEPPATPMKATVNALGIRSDGALHMVDSRGRVGNDAICAAIDADRGSMGAMLSPWVPEGLSPGAYFQAHPIAQDQAARARVKELAQRLELSLDAFLLRQATPNAQATRRLPRL